MTPGLVSVIIVSRNRPAELRLCLLALSQQYHAPFEVVVVADRAGIAALAPDWTDRVIAVPFDDQNISAARNAGIAAATGEVIAFIDDDAVAEPTWLSRLAAPVLAGRAPAAGGLVLGRNGISVQWGARRALPDGSSVPVEPAPVRETVFVPEAGVGLKTEGTNMAFSAATLCGLGGFDPAFRFYLDEADLNLRMAKAGLAVAFVPDAVVHHGFAPSLWRRADRVPRTLFDIGASLAVFLRKHDPAGASEAAKAGEWRQQRRRLIGHMIAGRLEPGAVLRILETFCDGWTQGLSRPIGALAPIVAGSGPSRPLQPLSDRSHLLLVGRPRDRARLARQARAEVEKGGRATVHIFSRTALYHRRWFGQDGIWWQTGGLFGRSDRDDPLWMFWRLSDRAEREWSKTKNLRLASSN